MRGLKAKLGGKAAGVDCDALQKQVDELKQQNAGLVQQVRVLKLENAELRALLEANAAKSRSSPKPRGDEIDTDAFALCGAPRLVANGDKDAKDRMQASQCLATLAHAQATQRAVTFFALQDALLSQALDGARSHLATLENSLSRAPEPLKVPIVEPLKAQAVELERGIKVAKGGEEGTKRRFVDLRQRTIEPVTIAMRATARAFVEEFDRLDVGPITSAVERLHNTHKLLSADDMAKLQRGDGAVLEDKRSLEFLQRLYAVAKAVQEPLGKLLRKIGKDVEEAGGGGGGGEGGGASGKVEVQMGKLKGLERVFEKTMEEYDGDFSRLGDIVRGSLVCDNVWGVVAVLERVSTAAAAAAAGPVEGSGGAIASLQVVRIKNRLDAGFDAEAESGGYRDILVNVAVGVDRARVFGENEEEGGGGGARPPSGNLVFLVCEIQVHLRGFHDIKGAGGAHKLYKQARSLHLLDKELGQAYVHGDKRNFDAGLKKVKCGECHAFRADFFKLDEDMATRLRDALLDRSACSVEVLSLLSAVSPEVVRVFDDYVEGLREVELSDNAAIDGAFVALFVSKHIRVLKFRSCRVGKKGMEAIASRLAEVGAVDLQELGAEGNCLRSAGATAFAPPLKELKNLTTLNLSHNDFGRNNFGSEGAKAIALPLKFRSTLVHLNLRDNDFGSEGATAMEPSLKELKNLTHLNLGDNNFGSEGATVIAPSLAGMWKLTHLNLSGNNLGSEGAKAIEPSLVELKNLTHLNLSRNKLGSGGVTAIQGPLVVLHLTNLDLSGNELGSAGARALAPSLKKLWKVTHLDLSGNDLGSEGATAIAPSLTELKSLTTLNLSGNSLGREGAAGLAPSLRALNLTNLDLSVNNLESEGAAAIARSLEGMNLTLLDLGVNNLGGEGAKAIAPSLKTLKNLTTLYLNANALGSEGADAITPPLVVLTNLAHVNLSENDLTPADEALLKKHARPHCEIEV